MHKQKLISLLKQRLHIVTEPITNNFSQPLNVFLHPIYPFPAETYSAHSHKVTAVFVKNRNTYKYFSVQMKITQQVLSHMKKNQAKPKTPMICLNLILTLWRKHPSGTFLHFKQLKNGYRYIDTYICATYGHFSRFLKVSNQSQVIR